MKSNFFRAAAIVLLCIGTVCSCGTEQGEAGKDGADGKDGKDGVNGTNGANGADGKDGAVGANGATIHSGTTAPATSLGAVGDFYIDTNAKNLYGPKTDAGWGSPVSLTGPAGPQGIPGNDGAMMYVYGSRKFTILTTYVFPVPIADVYKSITYAYFRRGSYYMPVPGNYHDNSYTVSSFLAFETTTSTGLNINLTTGTSAPYDTEVTWDEFRIILVPIPAGNITQMSVKPSIYYGNYAEVAAYYGFPE